jgi:TonB family protein
MRLQDGSLLVREEHELLGRDADGRFFDESYAPAASGQPSQHHFIFADPIAKREVAWTEGSTTAYVTPLPSSTRLSVSALLFDRRVEMGQFPKDKTTVTTDDLGSKMIDGVTCAGTRTVTTLAAGVIGNAEPLQRSEEVWIADDLQIVIAETDTDPMLGTRMVSMAMLERTAPPAGRFGLPEGLTIKESALGSMPGFPNHVVPPKIGSTVNVYGTGNGVDNNGEPYMVGNGVSAPDTVLSPPAKCSNEARRAKYQGIVLVTLTVDAQGDPQNQHEPRPIGMGLDEEALQAVQGYKFKPAMKDGKPVPVRITIGVNFDCSND